MGISRSPGLHRDAQKLTTTALARKVAGVVLPGTGAAGPVSGAAEIRR